MGTQFWWFYDAAAAAIMLVCIFLGGKKGFMKSVFSAAGCILAAVIAFAVSGTAAESIYKGTIQDSNAKKIERNIESDTFVDKYADYLESMGYTIKVNKSRLEEIFGSDVQYDEAVVTYVNNVNARKADDEAVVLEKIHEGYAVVIGDIVSESLSKFAAETAAETIRTDSSGMQELIPLLMDSENHMPAAKYIAEKYTAAAYETIFGLAAFVILFIVLALLIICCIGAFAGSRDSGEVRTSSHVTGGIIGIISGAAVVFAAAAAVRLWAVMGSNEMLFFNNEAVGKTYVFKYFYDIITNL